MLLAYIDESYDREEYWLTGLVVPTEGALQLQNDLDAVVRTAALNFGIPLNAELHGHPLLQAKDVWVPMKVAVRARINLYAAALQAVAACEGVQIVMAGINIPRLNRRYTAPHHPHREALDRLTQSVNALAGERDTDFLAIADEIDESDTYRASYWDMQRLDTLSRYGGKLNRAVDALHFAPSHHSRLLQAADLVSFLHFRIRRTPVTDSKSAKASADLWDIIESRVWAQTLSP
jgi:hypothetical protein